MSSYIGDTDGTLHDAILAINFNNGSYFGLIAFKNNPYPSPVDRNNDEWEPNILLCLGTNSYDSIDTSIPYKEPYLTITWIVIISMFLFSLSFISKKAKLYFTRNKLSTEPLLPVDATRSTAEAGKTRGKT